MIALRLIAAATHGRVVGDRAFVVKTIGSLQTADADSLTFCVGPQQESQLRATAAGAALLRAEHAGLFSRHKVIVEDPYLAYARASALFAPPRAAAAANEHAANESASSAHAHSHPSAIIAPSASLQPSARVGPYSVIGANTRIAHGVIIGSHASIGGDCVIGRHTRVEDGARIHARTRIGARCHIASGAVLGASGFGYAENAPQGEWIRIEQLGGVRMGDDVDIGANTTIDRGALDDTVIGNGVKLDNHIQIAHNVRIGDHTIMAGCVAIAGSAVIGKRCRLGGRAAILGHLEIADDVRINADSFVTGSITEAGVYSSMLPAQPAARWRKTVARLHRLEKLAERRRAAGKLRRSTEDKGRK